MCASFKGRAIDTINVVVNHRWRYPPQLIVLIEHLLGNYTDAKVAEQLNQLTSEGWLVLQSHL